MSCNVWEEITYPFLNFNGANEICVFIGSLMAPSHTSTNVDLPSEAFCGIHLKAVSQELLMKLISNICPEVTHWNYHHNELMPIYFLKFLS